MSETRRIDPLLRREGESDIDYHRRMIYGKLVDKTLADFDYLELSEYVYGKPYSEDCARRMFYGSRYTLDLLGSLDTQDDQEEKSLSILEERISDLQKEKQKFYDQRNAYNAMLRKRARDEELNDIITDAISLGETFKSLPELKPEECKFNGCGNNDLLISLNDIHYGANVDNHWNKYDSSVFARDLGEYAVKIIDIAKLHNSVNLFIFGAGDFISGSIHKSIQVTNKENVIQQVMGVSELVAQFIAALSPYFKQISFSGVGGNHSRLEKKEDALTDERLDDLVGWYLKARLQNYTNVKFDIHEDIDPTVCLMRIRGKTYLGTHGDYEGSKSKIQSLISMVDEPVYAILCGHLHHNSIDTVDGVKVIMAGSFLGVDEYCVEKRILGKPEQMVCVCDADGIVCHYDIGFKERK